ncbi:hypothetical protein ACO0KY_10600 [Undibacterium sp. Dicai25W]|uniref:hypothetical protein n=1 Tax=Undibacterium sp. Dicai25W TaxID=3413034 RepID=UPI003BEF9E3E
MNCQFTKIALMCGSVVAALSLSACGGGTVTVGTDGGGTFVPVAISSSYNDINFLQSVNGTSSGIGSIADYGPGGQTGSIVFGSNGMQSTSGYAVSTSGNVYWGNNIYAALGFDTNANDSYTPSLAMICNPVANGGVGANNETSTDVLVSVGAMQIFSGLQLAGLTFTQYYENCQAGGSIPARTSGNNLTFNADGSATIITVNGGSQVDGIQTLTPTQVNAALQGLPVPTLGPLGAYTTFTAYQYKNAAGSTNYAVVEHGSYMPVNLTNGYVAVWY